VIRECNVRRGLCCLGLGVALIVVFRVLLAVEIWGFVASSPNIGGGLLPLAGVLFIFIGIGFVIQGWLDHRSRE